MRQLPLFAFAAKYVGVGPVPAPSPLWGLFALALMTTNNHMQIVSHVHHESSELCPTTYSALNQRVASWGYAYARLTSLASVKPSSNPRLWVVIKGGSRGYDTVQQVHNRCTATGFVILIELFCHILTSVLHFVPEESPSCVKYFICYVTI